MSWKNNQNKKQNICSKELKTESVTGKIDVKKLPTVQHKPVKRFKYINIYVFIYKIKNNI